MNKAELIADVAERIGDSKQKGEEAVNAVFDAITAALKRGDDVRLPSFGVFAVSQTKERKARNPRTNEEVIVPAANRPKFRPGKALKEALG
ncbi:MAG TPA: HU family DNA-binding protein [Vitreimonas sp.]|uniref:HU family DNA-binding protein n=1 Tax=Vitreimonas sp. TaxID=3069702 RepID=UPI002D5E2162|nr:HU family DNA-binding protein [Vitreimonas sp.]HYD87429.1 HU family DNA-binding protein [Vitreimonas sp.]